MEAFDLRQEIRFCTTADGTRIAYATSGQGPPLVKAPSWLTHLEYDWEASIWRHWLEELSKDHLLVRFDQRGCGLSDRDVEDISLEAWVSDLEAVVDAVGVQRFALLGGSQGAPAAIEYAARHPERVSQLILMGGFSKRQGRSPSEVEALMTLVREGWGRDDPAYRQLFTGRLMPGGSQAEMQSFNELSRVSSTGEGAARTLSVDASIDVTNRLPCLSVPTLVLHSLGDQSVSFSEGRKIAALIPNARLVALDSPNHTLLSGEPAWQVALSEIRAFLASGPGAEKVDRSQATASNSRLSHRELEVLRLVAAGRSNQQIADELVISLNTVRRHVSNVFDKTGARNRTEASVYARDHGLA